MSNVCDICGKKPGFGKNVSHSHKKTPRRWNPNIQTATILVEGKQKRVRICAKCLNKQTAAV